MTEVVTFDPSMPSLGCVAIAIGMFDGVHVGHQLLVRDTIDKARGRSVRSCVVTFDCDPDSVVTPDRATRQLTTFEDRIALLSALGPDLVLVIPFDRALAALSAEEFLADILLRVLTPVSITVGCDFRFGSRAAGSVSTMQHSRVLAGVEITPHALLTSGDEPVTSTRIRKLVAAGELAEARELLGRPHRLRGLVMRGRGAGASLGARTANIAIDERMAIPHEGVYAAVVEVDGERYRAAVTVGSPPSFPEAQSAIEAHLIGFSGNLYGKTLQIEFYDRLRALRAYEDLDALKAAIADDIKAVQAQGLL